MLFRSWWVKFGSCWAWFVLVYRFTSSNDIGCSLSRNIGYSRDYQDYPYGDYEKSRELYFPVRNRDLKVHPKSIVYGIEIGSYAKSYMLSDLQQKKKIVDRIGKFQIRIELLSSGEVSVLNLKTREKLISHRMFWFAWKAFYPHTQLYND